MEYWSRFTALCARSGKSPNKVAAELGVASGTVTGWKNGREPSERLLRRVADYFGVSTDYLRGTEPAEFEDGELAEYLTALKNDPQQRVLFNLVSDATVDEVRATVAFLRTLREQRDE